MLGDRTNMLFRSPGHAGVVFRRYLRDNLSDELRTMQVVLDDDDGVSSDFVEVMRAEAKAAASLFKLPEEYTYISQPKGVTVAFQDGSLDLAHRMMPFTMAGLCLAGHVILCVCCMGPIRIIFARFIPGMTAGLVLGRSGSKMMNCPPCLSVFRCCKG